MNAVVHKVIPSALVVLLMFTSLLILLNLPPVTEATSTYDDEFNSTTLDPKWSWFNQDATHWSLTANPGYMQIVTQVGDIPQSGTGPAHNILLESPPSGDFEILTKVDFVPTDNYQQAGLIVFKSEAIFAKLVRLFANGSQIIQFGMAADGAFVETITPFMGTTTYLKIQKTDTSYTGYFSPDGNTWTLLAAFNVPALTSFNVGLVAINATAYAPEINANFDYFRANTLATAVAQLQQQVIALQTQISALQTPVSAWQTQIPAIQTPVSAWQTQVTSLANDVSNLE